MTGHFALDWALMSVSLFNTSLFFWLGLTVLLNAEHRPFWRAGGGGRWGVWLASGGLLMGGAFFVSHSAILGHGLAYVGSGLNFWWRVGWISVSALPFTWYVTILWYTGLWRERQTRLRRRQLIGLVLTAMMAAGSAALLIFANPIPSFTQVTQLNLVATPAIGGIPLLILIYPPYIVLCIGLALDALRRPGPAGRAKDGGSEELTRTLARRRARPWLVAASIALLLASLLVSLVMFRLVWTARVRPGYVVVVSTNTPLAIGRADLLIAGLIAVATLALGQALVSYEVFTGKTLPRRGLRRYWRNAIILAAGYSFIAGWSLTFHLRAIYSLLLSILIIVLFYALLSWRSYAERERYIAHLRPFVASQRLYEQLLSTSAHPAMDAATPFRALCRDVLGVRVAYLAALGPLAPLVGPPLAYPDASTAELPPLARIATQFHSPNTMCKPLDPTRYGGATWAVPLWSERGLIGVLLLGEKHDGGLYTQEEIEIARASGERLIDTQASAEMARRLMALQRQRMAESQIIDRGARRVLHDEILPRLHTAMLTLNGAPEDALSLLTDVHRQVSDLLHKMPTTTAPQVARLGLFGALRRAVDDELGDAFDRITWRIEAEAGRETQRIPSLTTEVLFYAAREAIRNAARHGRDADSERPLHLDVFATWREGLQISIEDNGVGVEATRLAGGESGHGLALHGTMMAVVGGSLAVESAPGIYTRVVLTLPMNGSHRTSDPVE